MILISHQETSPWQSPLFLFGEKLPRRERGRALRTPRSRLVSVDINAVALVGLIGQLGRTATNREAPR